VQNLSYENEFNLFENEPVRAELFHVVSLEDSFCNRSNLEMAYF